MRKPDYYKIALKIGRMAMFADIHNCGAPSDSFPVNLYCETLDNIRFYVAFDRYSGWQVDYTDDPEIRARKDMTSHSGFRNQTETLKFVKENIVSNSKYAKM